jgi:hypothetical protein
MQKLLFVKWGTVFAAHKNAEKKKKTDFVVKTSLNAGDSGGPLLLVDRGSKATVIGVVRYLKFLNKIS